MQIRGYDFTRQTAQENEARMNGTKDIDTKVPDSVAPQPAVPMTNVPQP